MLPRPRAITPADAAAAVALLHAAYGFNPSFESRLRAYVAIEPGGWVVVEEGSALIGIGGFVSFGPCAYIGLMAASPGARRRGVGAAVFEELLGRCEARACSFLLLDASDAGAPLYEKYAFRDHGTALSFTLDPPAARRALGEPSPALAVQTIDPSDESTVAEIASFDARCYGADRSPLVRLCLREHPGRAFAAREPSGDLVGYAVGQARSFGPCMARSTEAARALLHRALGLPFDDRVTWLVAGQNGDAVALARELGGDPARRWRHMRRGDPAGLESDWSSLFAKVSLAVG